MNLGVIFILVFACIGSAEFDTYRTKTIIDAAKSFTHVASEMNKLTNVAQDASKMLKAFSAIGAACGPLSLVFGSLSSVLDLFTPNPTQQLMDAIKLLHTDMQKGFNEIKEMIHGVNGRIRGLDVKQDFKQELLYLQDQEELIEEQMLLWEKLFISKTPRERMEQIREACKIAPPDKVIDRVRSRLVKQKIGSPNLFLSLLDAHFLEKDKVEAVGDRVTYLFAQALILIPLCGSVRNNSHALIDEDIRWSLDHITEVVTKVSSLLHRAYHQYKYHVRICMEEVKISKCDDGVISDDGDCEIYTRVYGSFENQYNEFEELNIHAEQYHNQFISGYLLKSEVCIDTGTIKFDGTNDPFYYMHAFYYIWRGGRIKYSPRIEEDDPQMNDPILTTWDAEYSWPGTQGTVEHLQKMVYSSTQKRRCEHTTCRYIEFKPMISVEAEIVNFYNGIRWNLTIKTGSEEGADTTDRNVHIIIVGSNGAAEKVILDNFNEENEFGINKTAQFDFWTLDVGQLTEVKFQLENKTDGWQLASAVLLYVNQSKRYIFEHPNKWIDVVHETLILIPDTSSKPIHWKLELKTGSEKHRLKSASKDSKETIKDVYIVIIGSKGVSEMVMPHSNFGNDFREGTTDTFRFGTEDIGEVKSVTFGIANGNGGWQMESAELTLEETKDKYSFTWNKLLDVDDETSEKEYTLVPDLELQWGMETKTYCCHPDAAAQGKVYTILKGKLGESPKIYLSLPDGKAFQKGAMDLFHFGTHDLGELYSVRIGMISDDYWYVEWVSLTLKNNGKQYIFIIDTWLGNTDYEMELHPLDNIYVHSGALLSKHNHQPQITHKIPPVICNSEKFGQFGEFKTYYIYNGYRKPPTRERDVLQVPAGPIHHGSPIEHCTLNGGEAQRWKVIPVGTADGAAYIISTKGNLTNKVIEVPFYTGEDYRVQLSDFKGTYNQRWRFAPGYFETRHLINRHVVIYHYCKIINVVTGQALDTIEKESCGSTIVNVNWKPTGAIPKPFRRETQQWYFNLSDD